MSNPKFAVGDLVAVCTPDLCVVIPKAQVISVSLDRAGMYKDGLSGLPTRCPAGYSYVVTNAPPSWNGEPIWFIENRLRPILPGEYDESTQDASKPIEVDA